MKPSNFVVMPKHFLGSKLPPKRAMGVFTRNALSRGKKEVFFGLSALTAGLTASAAAAIEVYLSADLMVKASDGQSDMSIF